MLFPGVESRRFSLLSLLLVLCCPVWLACGGEPDSPVDGPGVSSVRSLGVLYTPPATATPWPTFTPVPPPSPTALPTATPVSVLLVEAPRAVPSGPVSPPPTGAPEAAVPVPAAVSGGGPSAAAPDGSFSSSTPVPSPSPSPVPYGKVPGEEVYFYQQSFFPLQVSRLPERLRSGNPDVWPRTVKVVSAGTRYVVWAVAFDVSSAPDDFVLEGFVRWTDVTPGLDPLIMLESPKRISKVERLFYTGLGRGTPGFWKRGSYRVEFMDDEFESFLSWEFEVR